GEECPLPGIGTFQQTLSVLLQRMGTLVSAEVPSPRGPRQPGHCSARIEDAKRNANRGTPMHVKRIVIHLSLGAAVSLPSLEKCMVLPQAMASSGSKSAAHGSNHWRRAFCACNR